MTNENQYPTSIKRNLYKNSRLSIDFFMYAPQVLLHQNSYVLNTNPVVIFKYINPNLIKDAKTSYNENAYKMTPKNQHKIVRFFNTVVNWFYDKDLKDLFLINDNEELVFNADYNHINTILSKGKFDVGLMKAMPSLVMFENERYEGIYLYINKFENLITLTRDEVETICDIVKNFNFVTETMANIIMLNYAERTGSVITDMAVWNKLNGKYSGSSNGNYVSPFDKK